MESIRKLNGVTESLIHLAKISKPHKYDKHDSQYRRVLDTKDEHGRTILHLYAAAVGSEYLVERLRDPSPSKINAPDCDGRTALHLACLPTDQSIRGKINHNF